MVAQNLAVLRVHTFRDLSPGSRAWTAEATGFHDIFLYGPGGRGGSSAGVSATNGGGGGASRKRVWLHLGQVVSYTVGDTGSMDTSASVGNLFSFTATRGVDGFAGYQGGGSGGIGVGGDYNRRGGTGAGYTNPNGDIEDNDGVFIDATSGEGGGLGSTTSGGGGAGFREILSDLYGNGGRSSAGGSPGGGGTGASGGNTGTAGGTGAFAVIWRA